MDTDDVAVADVVTIAVVTVARETVRLAVVDAGINWEGAGSVGETISGVITVDLQGTVGLTSPFGTLE